MTLEWGAIVAVAIALLGAIGGLLMWRGAVTESIRDLKEHIVKHEDNHDDHYAHASKREIHRESMDAALVNEKFDNTNRRIENMGTHLEGKISSVSEQLREVVSILTKMKP